MTRWRAAVLALVIMGACSSGGGSSSTPAAGSTSSSSANSGSSAASASNSASGSSSGDDNTSPSPGNRACNLLSRSEIEESFGGQFDVEDNGGGPNTFPDGTSGKIANCTFKSDDIRIDVTLYTGSSSGPASYFNQVLGASNAQDPKPTPVAAGEQAFVSNEFGYVLENGAVAQIEYSEDLPQMSPEEAHKFYVDTLTPLLGDAAFELQD